MKPIKSQEQEDREILKIWTAPPIGDEWQTLSCDDLQELLSAQRRVAIRECIEVISSAEMNDEYWWYKDKLESLIKGE